MPAETRILGIDYGSKRVGLALSDPMGIIASGIGTIDNDERLMVRLGELVAQHHVSHVVVGLPLTLRGESGDAVVKVKKFVALLQQILGIPVLTYDERFTSTIAEQTIRDMGVGKKKRRDKAKVDEIAAVVLLQDFLGSTEFPKLTR